MISNGSEETSYWKLVREIGSTNGKWPDSVSMKANNIRLHLTSNDITPRTLLFTHFNPIALDLSEDYQVTVIGHDSLHQIFDLSNITLLSSLDQAQTKFDLIFALDEFFTFFQTEQQQRDTLLLLKSLTNSWLITTLQDYKNAAPYKKNQVDAITISGTSNYLLLENSVASKHDKQSWQHYWYCIENYNTFQCFGPYQRRTVYFKQLAKYCSDLNSSQYFIQKNLLYKGFFSKNFEHIISVKF